MNNTDTWKYEKEWSLRSYTPREEQKQIITQIMTAIENDYQNIILEAGTGVGKSAIATTISQILGESYILTMTNQLQHQYLDDFEYLLTEIKGRSNYSCNYGRDCSECQMEIEEENKCEDCSYLLALRKAQRSKHVISNYNYLYYAGVYAQLFDSKKLLILDESHNLEAKLMSLTSKTLNRKTIAQKYGFDIFSPIMNDGATLKSINNKQYWIQIAERLYHAAESQRPKNPIEVKRQEAEVKKYLRLLSTLENEDWIIELPQKKEIINDKKFQDSLKVEFKPLTIDKYTEPLLNFGEHRLFMTGTLGDKNKFCEWIGLDKDNTYYVYMKSPFPLVNRPIMKSYIGRMSGRNEKGYPNWRNNTALDKVDEIIEKHAHEKGVIHTSSNQQAWFLKKGLKNKNQVWVAQGQSREETIKMFEKSTKPVTLIGAGIKDGVDFKGDKCRFQILFKMPFPNLSGAQVNIRKNIDPDWYAYQTVMPLMQSYGRGIRDMDDYCTTYVIDSDFERLISQYKYLFNDYFLEAIQEHRVPRKVPKANVGAK